MAICYIKALYYRVLGVIATTWGVFSFSFFCTHDDRKTQSVNQSYERCPALLNPSRNTAHVRLVKTTNYTEIKILDRR